MNTTGNDCCWTERDLQILEALALKVRMLTVKQVGRTWWHESSPKQQLANARNRLRHLQRAGLVARYVINSHPLLELSEPVRSWGPRDRTPDFHAAARQLQCRWREAAQPLILFTATRKTSNLFGGFPVRLKSLQGTHDVHLSQVYVFYQQTQPYFASRWLGEDALKRAGYGVKEPDAFVMGEAGTVARVVEFGGKYAANRVRDFHEHCEARDLPYELW